MIPKIIHYTWFSGDPYPEKIKNCMDSWKTYLSDYEFVHWDMNRIKDIPSVWLQECIEEKKWAFAADYVRLYALYHFGGIYLDTDCMVYKSFDDLLNLSCFIGKENLIQFQNFNIECYLASHCIGAEKGNGFIELCLSHYNNRHFKLIDEPRLPKVLRYDMTLLPFIQSEIAKTLGYNPTPSYQQIQELNDVTIFPSSYFDPHSEKEKFTYCKHLGAGSWIEPWTFVEKMTWKTKLRWYLLGITRRLIKHL